MYKQKILNLYAMVIFYSIMLTITFIILFFLFKKVEFILISFFPFIGAISFLIDRISYKKSK